MCLPQDSDVIEYYSPNDTTHVFESMPLEWPFKRAVDTKLIIACDECYFPITFEEHVIDEIRDENNISFGVVIVLTNLFKKVGVAFDNPWDAWQTCVYCKNCGQTLSHIYPRTNGLSTESFYKLCRYNPRNERVVILWTNVLFRGSESAAHELFKMTNES